MKAVFTLIAIVSTAASPGDEMEYAGDDDGDENGDVACVCVCGGDVCCASVCDMFVCV